MKKHIFLVRHGQTDFNKQGIVQGSGVNSSLNQMGHQQAQAFFNFYQQHPFEVVITSALIRTHETMKPFIEKGLPWEQFAAINEMSWGIHEGQHRDAERRKEYQKMMDAWAQGNFDAKLEGGESANEMAHRIQSFVDRLHHRPESHILICSHGRAMRCIICLMMQQPLFEMEQYEHANTGLYQLTLDNGQFELIKRNDRTHLKA